MLSRFPNTSRFVLNYMLGLLFFSAATGILYLLRDILDTPLIALLFLLPVGLNTAVWGLGPGILSALSAFLCFNYFFIRPYYTFAVHQTSDLVVLIVFFVVAVVISQLVGRARAGQAAATARESEATKLYELSTALAGLQDDQSIARILAEHTLQTFQAERVELTTQSRIQNIKLSLPEGIALSLRTPELLAPLQTVRGTLGEIRLWRAQPLNQPAEERLLQTFASQGAMALERAWLTQTETRAKVLEESDRLKSALLSSVSHELRSPLATIKASITSLRSGNVQWKSSAREDLLAAVDDETDHLNRLVGNLLDMSRIESGALKPQRQWNLIGEIVGGVIARMRQAAENHKLDVQIAEDLPLVPVDYVQMEQVFDNLISNSLKYAPPNTTIHITAQKQNKETLLVKVSNQGPTVPQEHLDRIFDKFYRVTDADRVTGTGLGLSICKGIIEAHGGHIWAENLSDGFAFNFTLPLTLDGTPPPHLPIDPETI
ncbi:MAG TPA: ATP-binding protein [Anaerolineales bacterium]|nr:ATP-binding protein [Anaerolineales bacterium]